MIGKVMVNGNIPQKWHAGPMQNVIFPVIFWCTREGTFFVPKVGYEKFMEFPYFIMEKSWKNHGL